MSGTRPDDDVSLTVVTSTDLRARLAVLVDDLATWQTLLDQYGTVELLRQQIETDRWLLGEDEPSNRISVEPCPVCGACARCWRQEHSDCHGCPCGCSEWPKDYHTRPECHHGPTS